MNALPSVARQLRPTVTAHGNGRVVVGWQEEAKGRPAVVRVAVSEDGGLELLLPHSTRTIVHGS